MENGYSSFKFTTISCLNLWVQRLCEILQNVSKTTDLSWEKIKDFGGWRGALPYFSREQSFPHLRCGKLFYKLELHKI